MSLPSGLSVLRKRHYSGNHECRSDVGLIVRTTPVVRSLSLIGLPLVLLGVALGLGIALAHPPSAVSAPRCSASSASSSDTFVTLKTSLPYTSTTVLVGHRLVVLMPGHLSTFHISNEKILRPVCSSAVVDHNTEIVLMTLAPGQSDLGATDQQGAGGGRAVPVFGARVVIAKI